MKRTNLIWLIAILIILGLLVGTYIYLQPFIDGIRPAWLGSQQTISQFRDDLKTSLANEEIGPLIVHDDYVLRLFTDDVESPRVLIEDNQGGILVSEPNASRVSLFRNGDKAVLLSELGRPHGLAIKGDTLYIAETGQVLSYSYDGRSATNREVLLDLPADGRHWTRTIGIGPDGALYISVGSSCNICLEEDWRRTKILRYDFETQELETFASGLRNAVFFEWNDLNQLFATEMGRDWLGDDLPPDELNLIQRGDDYGYPYCYGQNSIDPEFNDAEHCSQAEPAFYNFQAHEAPLGLDFLNGDLVVALHGSWNRTEPVGYEVIMLSKDSDYQERETILSGFLQGDGDSFGRPAGVLVTSDNRILVSDDKADLIYELQAR